VRILKIAFENLNIVDRICVFVPSVVPQFSSGQFLFSTSHVNDLVTRKKTHTNSGSGVIARKWAKRISEESSDKNKEFRYMITL